MRKMLPGFNLTIEDNVPKPEAIVALKDVYVIYANLPSVMRYKDNEGEIYEKFIEPNKPFLITSKASAMETLDVSDLALTREVKNIISLLPDNASIALCRIVTRDGDEVDTTSAIEMYEALDFAFEMTENYPIKQIICAGVSLDFAVELNKTTRNNVKLIKGNCEENSTYYGGLIGEISNANGTHETVITKKTEIGFEAFRSSESLKNDKGIHDSFRVKIDGEQANIITKTGLKPCNFSFKVDYTGATPVIGKISSPEGLIATLVNDKDETVLTFQNEIKLKLDDLNVIAINANGTLVIDEKAKETKGSEDIRENIYAVRKLADNCDILRRILEHNLEITRTQNPCITILSPRPPKNSSSNEVKKYVNKCEELYEKVRDRLKATGKKGDLGMFLSVPVGVNMVNGLGGIVGFPQSSVMKISENKIITKNHTSAFTKGDLIEVYGHKKLDVVSVIATVTSVAISEFNTTEISLDRELGDELKNITSPKYIMNINNKDFNGTYLASQYAVICEQAGVKRSPAGLPFRGECQLTFSETQLRTLDSCKFSTLNNRTGTTQGEISKSQLLTDPTGSQYQDFETLMTTYSLVSKSKEIGMKYKGLRLTEGTDLGLIKKEIEDGVFKVHVKDKVIYPGYELDLKLTTVTQPNGKKEKNLHIGFTVREVETMKLISMTAKLF